MPLKSKAAVSARSADSAPALMPAAEGSDETVAGIASFGEISAGDGSGPGGNAIRQLVGGRMGLPMPI